MSAGSTPGPWEWDRGRLLHNVPGSHSSTVLMVHDETWRPMEVDARLIAAAPDGYAVAGAFIMAAINEYDIPEDADEGWILDTLGHGLGGAYLQAVAFRAKAVGQ